MIWNIKIRNILRGWQPRNRALTDIIGARDAALRLASFEALAGLVLLVRGENRLAAELDAVGLGVGPAARGALQNAAALQLRGDAEDRKDDLRKRLMPLLPVRPTSCR